MIVVGAALVTAMLALAGGIRLRRLAGALSAAVAVAAIVDVLRLALTIALVAAWGPRAGLGWSQTFFGALLTLVGMTAGAWLYSRLVRRGPTPVR
ncbi:hypothetical protein ACFQ9X_34035 [Catenulispora yoronensis]